MTFPTALKLATESILETESVNTGARTAHLPTCRQPGVTKEATEMALLQLHPLPPTPVIQGEDQAVPFGCSCYWLGEGRCVC